MVWLWKRGLKSSTVKHQHQLVSHRWKHPWSRRRGVSGSAVAPLQVQACSGHSWEKVGGKRKEGQVEPICLQTCYLSPAHVCINKWGIGFACALKMRWQRIAHSAHMLHEQERPDVGYGALMGTGGMALCRESVHVCVWCRDGNAQQWQTGRWAEAFVSSCRKMIAKDATFLARSKITTHSLPSVWQHPSLRMLMTPGSK